MRKIILIAGLLFLLTNVNFACAYEYQMIEGTPEKGDFILGPGKTDLVLDPGDETTKQISITNRLGKRQSFHIEVEDFSGSYDSEETVVLFGEEEGPYSLKDYVHPEIYDFSLEHGQRITIPVEIDIPEDSEPGGLYAAVLVSTVPEETYSEENVGKTKIISRLGTLFFLRVSGEIQESASLRDFGIFDSKSFYETGPIEFQIVVENEGSVHVVPSGKIEVTNLLGRKVGEIDISGYFVMPDSIRQRVVEWNKEGMVGMYTAHLILDKNYQSSESATEEAYVSFWVIPWKSILLIILFVVILLFILKKIIGSFRFEIKRK